MKMNKKYNNIDIINADLRKLSKSQLIKLLLKQIEESTPKPSL